MIYGLGRPRPLPLGWMQFMTLGLVLVICLEIAAESGSAGGGRELVLVQPGYPGSTEEAADFVTRLCAAIGEGGGLAFQFMSLCREGDR